MVLPVEWEGLPLLGVVKVISAPPGGAALVA